MPQAQGLADGAAVQMHAEAIWVDGSRSARCVCAKIAQVLQTNRTEPALSANRDESQDHVVADLQSLGIGSQALNNACAFMPGTHWQNFRR